MWALSWVGPVSWPGTLARFLYTKKVPRPSTTTRTVRDAIRDRILSGDYPPGSRLVEQRIAAELEVSRIPVRDALRDLLAEGLTRERPTGGMEVRHYSDAEIDELIALNGTLETMLAVRLAEEGDELVVVALRSATSAAGAAIEAGDATRAVALNARFHDVLLEQARGSITHELLNTLRPRLAWVHRQHGDPAVLHAEHVAIVEAIAARDTTAVAALIHSHSASSRQAVHDLKDPT